MAENNLDKTSKNRRVLLTLRGIGTFILLAVLFAGLYWFCLHHADNVAVWAGTDPADVKTDLVYEGQTFHLAASVGSRGVTAGRYEKDEQLGEVKPEGKDALTVCYQVWSVHNAQKVLTPEYLIVVYGNKRTSDGKAYVYYLDGIPNPYKGEKEKETEPDDWEDIEPQG